MEFSILDAKNFIQKLFEFLTCINVKIYRDTKLNQYLLHILVIVKKKKKCNYETCK